MRRINILTLAAMAALTVATGSPAFAKEVCRDVKIRVIECRPSPGGGQSCTSYFQTAQICKQVPDTTTNGAAAIGGVVQGGFSGSQTNNAVVGAKALSRLN